MTAYSGIVPVLDEAEYHAQPALSSTGARQLLHSPRTYQWAQKNPQQPKTAFDLGTAVHSKVLGVGAATIAIPESLLASNGAASTTAAKEFIAKARLDGLTPVKRDVAEEVDAMAEAVLAHSRARVLFEQEGNPEASVFATDPDTDVDMRARFDFLPNFLQDRAVAVDLKTSAKSASPKKFANTVADFGYHIQQEWYLHAYGLTTGDFSLGMEFVVVETAAPHLVGVYPLAMEFAELGAKRVKEALETYARCIDTGIWPGYDINPDPLQPPTWLIYAEGAFA